ncbi:3-isopropylmalate dehydrogenase [Burkholderia gladioli]|nr:3-isopropylmalate dehydrogenase [Burkholderia gladioli]MDN7496327.1 3-isopropylmalate dehydrogenase [Burkholderia gladioli]
MAQNRSISPVSKLHGITARALTRAIVSTKIITTKTITKTITKS